MKSMNKVIKTIIFLLFRKSSIFFFSKKLFLHFLGNYSFFFSFFFCVKRDGLLLQTLKVQHRDFKGLPTTDTSNHTITHHDLTTTATNTTSYTITPQRLRHRTRQTQQQERHNTHTQRLPIARFHLPWYIQPTDRGEVNPNESQK